MVGLMATSFAEKMALWRMYGKTRMAMLAAQALLQLNSLKYGVPQLGSPEVLALVRGHGVAVGHDSIVAE